MKKSKVIQDETEKLDESSDSVDEKEKPEEESSDSAFAIGAILATLCLVFWMIYFSIEDGEGRVIADSFTDESPALVDGDFTYYFPDQLLDTAMFYLVLESDPGFVKYVSNERSFKCVHEMDSLMKVQRQWLANIIYSDTYLERMLLCTDKSSAHNFQRRYLSHLRSGRYFFSSHPTDSKGGASGHMTNDTRDIFIHYVMDYDLTFLFEMLDPDLNSQGINYLIHREFTPLHELEHQASCGHMPVFVTDLFSKTFSEKRFLGKCECSRKRVSEYYSDPTEILARKRVLDYELELRGIKMYEEQFTEEHYEKIKFLSDKWYLSVNSDQFFYMFEKEDLIYIMNTVP